MRPDFETIERQMVVVGLCAAVATIVISALIGGATGFAIARITAPNNPSTLNIAPAYEVRSLPVYVFYLPDATEDADDRNAWDEMEKQIAARGGGLVALCAESRKETTNDIFVCEGIGYIRGK